MSAPSWVSLDELRRQPALGLLVLDGQHWLLPQADIRSLEPLLDINPTRRAPGSIGALAFAGAWWPVYGLSGELELLQELPGTRRVCLLLDNGADRFGLVCDRVETLAPPPRLFPVPHCMADAASPLRALALLAAGVGAVTDTECLAARLAALVEHADDD